MRFLQKGQGYCCLNGEGNSGVVAIICVDQFRNDAEDVLDVV